MSLALSASDRDLAAKSLPFSSSVMVLDVYNENGRCRAQFAARSICVLDLLLFILKLRLIRSLKSGTLPSSR